MDSYSFVVSGTFSQHHRVRQVSSLPSAPVRTSGTATTRGGSTQHLAATLLSTTAKVTLPEALAVNSYRGLDTKPRFVLAVAAGSSGIDRGYVVADGASAAAVGWSDSDGVDGRGSSLSTQPRRPSSASLMTRSRASLHVSRRTTAAPGSVTGTPQRAGDPQAPMSDSERFSSPPHVPSTGNLHRRYHAASHAAHHTHNSSSSSSHLFTSTYNSTNNNNNNLQDSHSHAHAASFARRPSVGYAGGGGDGAGDDGDDGADDDGTSVAGGAVGVGGKSPTGLRAVQVTTSVIMPGGVFGVESPADATVVAEDYNCVVFAVSVTAVATTGVGCVPDLVALHGVHSEAAQQRIRRFMTEPIAEAEAVDKPRHRRGSTSSTTTGGVDAGTLLQQQLLLLSQAIVGDRGVRDGGTVGAHTAATSDELGGALTNRADADAGAGAGAATVGVPAAALVTPERPRARAVDSDPQRSRDRGYSDAEDSDSDRHLSAVEASFQWVKAEMSGGGAAAAVGRGVRRAAAAAGVPVPISQHGRAPRSQVAYFMSPIDLQKRSNQSGGKTQRGGGGWAGGRDGRVLTTHV